MPPRIPPDDEVLSRFAQLLAAARRGSRESLGVILERCRPYLLTVARGRLPAAGRAFVEEADLAQDVLLRAARHFGQFYGESEAELLGWLRRILANCLADHVGREPPRTSQALTGAEPDDEETPSGNAVAAEEARALERAVRCLSATQQEVVLLHQRDGLSFVEIGRQQGRSPDAVRMLYGRAVKELARLLRPGPAPP